MKTEKLHRGSHSDCNTLFLVCTREDGLVSVLDIMKAGEAARSARNTLQQEAVRFGSDQGRSSQPLPSFLVNFVMIAILYAV